MKRGYVRVTIIMVVLGMTYTALAQSGDGYNLSQSKVANGGGTTSGVGYNLLGTVGEHDAGTMDGGGYELTGGFLVLVQCPASGPPLSDGIATKNRYLSFSAVDPARLQAVRVTFVDLPGPLAVLNGTAMWVGPTTQVSELSGKNDATPPTFTAATLDCLEEFADWATLGVVHVSHAFIVPGGIYDIQLIDEVCSVGGEAGFSAALRVTNSTWGDVVGPFEAGVWTAPDAVVSVAVDVVSILDKFSNAPSAPQKSRVDIEPDPVDGKVSILDVTRALDAFSGVPFPFNPVSVDPCP